MKSETEDIEMLERAILAEARDEADQVKAEAEKQAEDIRKRAREQAEVERRAILERARADAERIRSQVVATAQLKARSEQLSHREKLLDSVFEAVKAKLPELQKRPDYDQVSVQLLREALTQLRVEKAEVKADDATQKALQKAMNSEFKGEYSMAPLEEGTGVVVDAADGKLHYDNTLETRLSRLQRTLRSSVYQVLIGEK